MKRDIWIFLFFLGLVLFSWPAISIFSGNLSGYLFLVWFLFIVIVFVISTVTRRQDNGG